MLPSDQIGHPSGIRRKPLQPPQKPIPIGRVQAEGEAGDIRYDSKSVTYIFRWQGADGRLKQAVYTPPWRVRVIVAATVQRTRQDLFLYRYTVQVLPNSPQSLWMFTLLVDAPVQAVRGVQVPRGRVSITMGTYPKYRRPMVEFRFEPSLQPSQHCQVEFLSQLPPGIGPCYARGESPLMRVPEELPGVLQNLIPRPGQDEARGITVVPVPKPTIEQLIQDWQTVLTEGWVEQRVGREVANRLQQLMQQVRSGDSGSARQRGEELRRWLLTQQKACLPEAVALISETLLFLLGNPY